MLAEFQRLVRLDHDRHTAVVESATPLAERCATTSSTTSRDSTARRSHTSFGENPALIGGMRIKVGSDVYDGSIRAGSRRSRRRL